MLSVRGCDGCVCVDTCNKSSMLDVLSQLSSRMDGATDLRLVSVAEHIQIFARICRLKINICIKLYIVFAAISTKVIDRIFSGAVTR